MHLKVCYEYASLHGERLRLQHEYVHLTNTYHLTHIEITAVITISYFASTFISQCATIAKGVSPSRWTATALITRL